MKNLTIAPRVGNRYFSVLEDFLGKELPDEFKLIMKKYAGLSVLEDKFIDKSNTEWELQSFDNFASIVQLSKEFNEAGLGLLVPFAYDPGGWHFCLSFEEGTLGKIIINRWTDHAPEDQLLIIADTFEEFINGLEQSNTEF